MSLIADPPGALDLVRARATLAALADDVNDYVAASKAPATLRAYRTDWRMFSEWCDAQGLNSLPARPEAVAAYVAHLAGARAAGTIQRKLTSISVAHKAAGHESPTRSAMVQATWKGVRRTFGVAVSKKQALGIDDLRAMVDGLGDGLIDVRDRALLLVGFAAALRRSELVALDVDDIDVTAEGLVVTIRSSKTDQEAKGAVLGLPYGSNPGTCPVRAYRAWLDRSGITEGAVFRRVDRHGNLLRERMSGRAAAERIKVHAAAAGHDPDRIAGHSVRRGFITTAVRARVHERDVMRHSRHKSLAVFRGYVEEASVWDDNAAMAVGL